MTIKGTKHENHDDAHVPRLDECYHATNALAYCPLLQLRALATHEFVFCRTTVGSGLCSTSTRPERGATAATAMGAVQLVGCSGAASRCSASMGEAVETYRRRHTTSCYTHWACRDGAITYASMRPEHVINHHAGAATNYDVISGEIQRSRPAPNGQRYRG
jgi:hypothetical protein